MRTRWKLAVFAAAASGAALSSACHRGDAGAGESARVSATTARTARSENKAAGPDLTESPVLRAGAGLEATWLVSTVDRAEFVRALAPYTNTPLPISDAAVSVWEGNGLRLVGVPLAQWAKVAARLQVSGAVQRQWLDAGGDWTEIVRGPEQGRGQVIAMDAERMELAPGRLRLLSRCWLTPVPGGGAGADSSGTQAQLTVEIVPQLHETVAPDAGLSLGAPVRPSSPIEQGLVFSRLGAQLRITGGGEPVVYVLVPERPGVDWSQEPSESEAATDAAGSGASSATPAPGVGEVVRASRDHASSSAKPAADPDTAPPRSSARGGAGPEAPGLATLGEAMLGTGRVSAERASRSSSRAVLVLVPRAPAEFRLRPEPAARAPAPDAPSKR